MTNFIDWLALAMTQVKLVRAIEHYPGNGPDISIGVHDTRGNQNRLGVVLADHYGRHIVVRVRLRPVVPEAQHEIGWANEAKEIRLV